MRTHPGARRFGRTLWPERVPLALVATWLASAGATDARAQALDDVEIDWSGPPPCAEAGDVKAAVAELVGPEFRAKGEATFEVDVEPATGGGFAIELRAEGDELEGERRLIVASCKEAHDVVALLVAIALDPAAALRAEVAHEPWTPPEPVLHPWGALFGAGAIVDTNSLPGVTVAPELRFAWDLGLVRAGVRGRVYVSRTAERAATASTGAGSVSVTLWSGIAEACAMARFAALAVGPCAGIEAGVLAGAGVDVPSPSDASSAWFAVTVGGELDLKLSNLVGLDVQLGVALPSRRTRFAVRGDPPELLHETDPASFRAGLGVVVRLPP